MYSFNQLFICFHIKLYNDTIQVLNCAVGQVFFHAHTVLPPCSYSISSMLVQYCLYACKVLPPYPFYSQSQVVLTCDLAMLVRYCPLSLSGFVGYDLHSTNTRFSISHCHRWY